MNHHATRSIPATTPPGSAGVERVSGPRCNGCSKPITHTPGKRPKIYCSAVCRMRVKRALGLPTTATGTTAEAKTNKPLGTSVETATRAGQRPKANAAEGINAHDSGAGRDHRFERRETHQVVSLGKTFGGCGRRLIAGAATVNGGQTGGAASSFTGVMTCGMVHMCAWCAGRILAARAAYAQDAAEAWVKVGPGKPGGGVIMSAHTLRHFKRQKFGTLRKRERGGLVAVLHDAWSKAYGHDSGKMWQQAKAVHGVIGVLRSFEDTWGESTGFHLHFHAMWFTSRPLTPEEVEDFAETLKARWGHAVVAAGGYAVSEEHGVKVDHVDLDEAGAVGRYLFKDGDHARIEPIDGVGAEMAFGGEKNGKAGRLGPFQLGDAAATGEAAMVEAWQEREYGTYGVRKMYLSNGMRARLAALGVVDDRTDKEIAADAGAAREPLALIPRDAWYGHVVPVKGRRLALIRAAEALGVVGVRTLIESWGLVWGVDVLPAPAEVEEESAA